MSHAAIVHPVQKEWFKYWFDSPYYHLLYRNRDEIEAQQFIDALLEKLRPRPGDAVLDLACGKGRYSCYLEKKGLDVTGIDLSKASIEYARQFETANLSFFTHDMRLPFSFNRFDYVFNFFTSFGYFDSEADHLKTLKNVKDGLKNGGQFVLDFFNSGHVVNHLISRETKTIEGIHFELYKRIEGRYVVKTIDFEDLGQRWVFEERVCLFYLEDFERLFALAGLKLLEVFGDYRLGQFDLDNSPRLILIAQKP